MTSSCPLSSLDIRANLDQEQSEAASKDVALENQCSMSDGVGRYAALLKSASKLEDASKPEERVNSVRSLSSVQSGESQACGSDCSRSREDVFVKASDGSDGLRALERCLAPLCDMPTQLSAVLEKLSKVLQLLQDENRLAPAMQTSNRYSQMSMQNGRSSHLNGGLNAGVRGSTWSRSSYRPSSHLDPEMEQFPMYGSPRVSRLAPMRPSGATDMASMMTLEPPSSRPSVMSMASLCTVQSPANFMAPCLSGGSKDSGPQSPEHAISAHSGCSRSTGSVLSSSRVSNGQDSLHGAARQATNAARQMKYSLSYDADAPRASSRSRPVSISCTSESGITAMLTGRRGNVSCSTVGAMASIKEKRTDESGAVSRLCTGEDEELEESQKTPKLNRRCYSLKGPSFDNLESFGQDDAPGRFRCMLHPGSGFRLSWDVLVIGCSAFLGVLIPLGLVYCNACLYSPGIMAILLSVDVVFIIDILLNFRTGFWEDGHLVLNPWSIALHYAQSWLLIDLLSAWPLASAWVVNAGFWLWFPHCLKLLRLARIPKLLSNLKKETRWMVLTPIRIGLLVPLALHVTSCCWRLVQRLDDMEELDTWPATYVQDEYWVIMTVTTVGYGDVSPKGIHTRIYAIFLMCISSVCFGATVSALTHMSKNLFDDEVEHRVAMATNSMQERRVPLDLQHRVQTNLRKILRQDNHGSAMDPELLSLLSPALQRELLLSLLSATVLQFPLFNGAQRSFLAEIAQAHKWMQCQHYDLIVSTGQVIQDVFFVIAGTLSVRSAESGLTKWLKGDDEYSSEASGSPTSPTAQSGSGMSNGNRLDSVISDDCTPTVDLQPTFRGAKEMQIETGAWFGEACLFMEGVVSSSTIVAACEAELAVLAECDYTRIIQKYPRLLARHQKMGKAIHSGKLQLEELAYSKEDMGCASRLSMSQGGLSQTASRFMSLVRSMSVSPNVSWRVFPSVHSGSSVVVGDTSFSIIGASSQQENC